MNLLKLVFTFFILCYPMQLLARDRVERYTDPAEVVPVGQLPWIVQLNNIFDPCCITRCTAFLITQRHVLSAAHCFLSEKKALDSYVDFKNMDSKKRIKVKRFILHPDLEMPRTDIAIMELSEDVILDNHPLLDFSIYNCLNLASFIRNPFAAGYQGTSVLKKVSLSWLTRRMCQHKDLRYILNYPGDGKGGDSGSPLFYKFNNTEYLIGIHSTGSTYNGSPIIYTPIFTNADFITKSIYLNSSANRTYFYDALTSNDSEWTDLVTSTDPATSTTSTASTTSTTSTASITSTTSTASTTSTTSITSASRIYTLIIPIAIIFFAE
ncbi:trypsin-like serine protease [Endozoicomonas sp. ALC020]|uniref:trypsin-like serine protease n=1 Tax=unclassified Endozoicomonas TaxID=2644528 RepID=UPI003BAEF25D